MFTLAVKPAINLASQHHFGMYRIIFAGFVGMLTGALATYLLRGEPTPTQAKTPDTQYQELGSKIDRIEALLHQQRDTIAAYGPLSPTSGRTAPPARPDATPPPDSATSAHSELRVHAPKEEEALVAKILADIQAKSYDSSATFRETMMSDEWARLSPSAQQRVSDEVLNKVNSGEIPVGFIFPAARQAIPR